MHATRFNSLALAAISTCFLVAAGPSSAASYTYTPINYPGANDTQANGINNSGTIVGFYDVGNSTDGFTYTAFVDSNGTFTTILHGTDETQAYGINSSGEIVGDLGTTSEVGSNTFHGFLAADGSTAVPFDVVIGGTTALSTTATGINDSGLITGYYTDSNGVHGFLDDSGTFTALDVPDSLDTEAFGINNAGDVVGYFNDSGGGVNGFLYDPTNLLVNDGYTVFDVPGSLFTQIYGINNTGQIVGTYVELPVPAFQGFVGTTTSQSTILNPDTPIGTFAAGINDSDLIVGYGQKGDGSTSGFLATPSIITPEPSTVSTFCFAGLGLLGLMLRSRKLSRKA